MTRQLRHGLAAPSYAVLRFPSVRVKRIGCAERHHTLLDLVVGMLRQDDKQHDDTLGKTTDKPNPSDRIRYLANEARRVPLRWVLPRGAGIFRPLLNPAKDVCKDVQGSSPGPPVPDPAYLYPPIPRDADVCFWTGTADSCSASSFARRKASSRHSFIVLLPLTSPA